MSLILSHDENEKISSIVDANENYFLLLKDGKEVHIFIDKIMVELLPLNVGRLFNKYGVLENKKEIYNNHIQTFINL